MKDKMATYRSITKTNKAFPNDAERLEYLKKINKHFKLAKRRCITHQKLFGKEKEFVSKGAHNRSCPQCQSKIKAFDHHDNYCHPYTETCHPHKIYCYGFNASGLAKDTELIHEMLFGSGSLF